MLRAILLLASMIGTASANPCFRGKPSINALQMHADLEKFIWYGIPGEESPPPKPPPTKYGSCRVENSQVRTANGALVAELLACGVRVVVRGIVDDLGLQIGARGRDVLDRKKKPVAALTCFGNGPTQVRCRFERDPEMQNSASSYVVAGKLGTLVLAGRAAVQYFASRPLVELGVNICGH